jgi:hypothetical protein
VSYVAEPYAQFVDDLLTSLTGGVSREEFRFLLADAPFRLSPPGPVVRSTLLLFGQAAGAFARFKIDRDFLFTVDSTIEWKARAGGTPAADAVWPDEGTTFYVNYDHAGPSGVTPLLNDRNTGSVTRLLAESFAREYAVLSRQLEGVYQAAFVDTATGRDLEQLVALVGLVRMDRTFAVGTVVFGRTTPATADIFVPAGTRLSTSQPPAMVFETTEDRLLHRGSLTVEAPVRATAGGAAGAVAPRAITVIHRPIFGIDSVSNAQATSLSGATETDPQLRARAKRSLEASGKATQGAMLAALATLPGVREKDIRIDENHLLRPGVLALNIAVQLEPDDAVRAINLIEQTRPAGVRVLHNLDTPTSLGLLPPGENPADEFDTPATSTSVVTGLYLPVVVTAVLHPQSASLTPQERASLARQGEQAVRDFVDEAGIGETLVYNRLVANLMAIDGVLDVTAEMYEKDHAPAGTIRRNLAPPATLRPTVDPDKDGRFQVEVGGQLVAIDLAITITLTNAGGLGDLTADVRDAESQILTQLRETVGDLDVLSVPAIRGAIVPTENFTVDSVAFTLEFVEAGVRINQTFTDASAPVTLQPLQRPWLRNLDVEAA